MTCDRCGRETLAHTGSMFNMDQICLTCKEQEKKHPRYQKAVDMELEAVKSGDYNFPGIGLPADLGRRR